MSILKIMWEYACIKTQRFEPFRMHLRQQYKKRLSRAVHGSAGSAQPPNSRYIYRLKPLHLPNQEGALKRLWKE